MIKIYKHRIMVIVLLIAIIATIVIGYVSAEESEELYHHFWLSLPAYGITDLATERIKVATLSYAYYHLTTVTNTTGYNLYINVRSADGSTIVATAVPLFGTGSYNVYYLSGYGNTGTEYRPSGQTSSSSTKPGYIEGSWRP